MPRAFVALLGLLGLVLTLTVVPGVFTIDEDNYLVTVTALREGRLTVPGTEGLPPTPELAWFDPNGAAREVTRTPISSTAPPLYAPLALPFSYLGWRGLVALNTLAFLATTLFVFLLAKRYSRLPETPWIAAVAFAGGGYVIEYAQGMWPHMLTAALCTGAVWLSAQAREDGPLHLALVAGLLVGLAAGVRYQNIVFAACLGTGVLLFTRRRWAASVAYGAGVAAPLALSSAINHARLGIWNPVSKGGKYLSSMASNLSSEGVLTDALTMGWARIVDYSSRPPLAGTEHAAYLHQEPATGAFLVGSAMKKAWLQSSPWIAVALAVLLLAWLPWRRWGGASPVDHGTAGQSRELRVLALVIFPILGMFAASGLMRTDGLSYNQRYFIELVPLAAIALAWASERAGAMETTRRRCLRLTVGAALGGALAAAVLLRPAPSPIRLTGLLYLPLVLALLALIGWGTARLRQRPQFLLLAVGACLGWSLIVHLGDDLAASRSLRQQNAALARWMDPHLSNRTALVAHWGAKDAVGPLLLDREIVVLDVRNDQGRSAPLLVDHLLDRNWRVVVIPLGIGPRTGRALVEDREVRTLRPMPFPMIEILGPAGETQAPR